MILIGYFSITFNINNDTIILLFTKETLSIQFINLKGIDIR